MKKIWLMLLVICSVCAFSACSDDDKIPVTIDEGGMPKITRVSETITITGEGFDATAKFALRNEAEKDVEMEATVKSDKEVSCIVPDVEAGVYKVILIQAGEWEIGTIEIISVKKVVVPETAEAGETITITGEGFATTAKFKLQNEAEEKVDMETTFINDKEVSCIIPVVEAGTYKVILSQDGEWEIGTIEISVPERKPRVKEMLLNYDWKVDTYSFEYDEEGRISTINYYIEDVDDPMVYEIAYENDKIVVSNFQDFTYNLKDGRVISTSYEDEDGLADWPWTYNEDGYLTFGGYEEAEYHYTENNLTSIGYSALAKYEDAQYENKFERIDPVVCMYNTFAYALQGDIIDLIAHWLGICGKSSTYLPVQMTDDFGDFFPIQYTMDGEYVSEAKLQSEYSTYVVKFVYE